MPFPSEYTLTNDAVGTRQLSSNTSNVTELVHRRPSDWETFCFRFSRRELAYFISNAAVEADELLRHPQIRTFGCSGLIPTLVSSPGPECPHRSGSPVFSPLSGL